MALEEYVASTLAGIEADSYLEQVPRDTNFPYITYRFPSSSDIEAREDFVCEVDIWDNNPDNSTIEALADSVKAALDRSVHLASGLGVIGYLTSRLQLPDPNPTIRRRQLRFELRTYFF